MRDAGAAYDRSGKASTARAPSGALSRSCDWLPSGAHHARCSIRELRPRLGTIRLGLMALDLQSALAAVKGVGDASRRLHFSAQVWQVLMEIADGSLIALRCR